MLLYSKMKLYILACLVSSCLAVTLFEPRISLPTTIRAQHPELMIIPKSVGRIIGGEIVGEALAPYQVAVYLGISFVCGGALVSSRVVVTAAHCVYGFDNGNAFTIRYGSVYLNKAIEIPVASVVRHSSYNPTTFDNDIAVLKLELPIMPSCNVSVIKLPIVEPNDHATLTVTGWGRTTASGSTLPNQLQKASVQVMSRSDCATRWNVANTVTARMICAHNAEQSACAGDTGGPVVKDNVLVGLVSWGPSSCLHNTYPNVYTNVASFRTWIETQIN